MRLYLFVAVTFSVVRRKILSMFKNLWSQLFVTTRLDTFINGKSSYSVRQQTLEIATVCKLAYRGQIICISSERWRSRDASLRFFANCSEHLRIETI